jgi:hypothetical protein
MVNVKKDWHDNVKIFCDDEAIRWKASQKKDAKKICSENSEDVLTWQVFRTLEANHLLNRWMAHSFGLEDQFVPYYWQRRYSSSEIDPDIKAALSEIEPYHEKHGRQHTETDLILRGNRHLVMCEIKLGYKCRRITGWQQAANSPVVNDYQPYAVPFVSEPDRWKALVSRFAQLYKNLMLGNVLCSQWATDPLISSGVIERNEERLNDVDSNLRLHLLAVVNGATTWRATDGTCHTYEVEFGQFCKSCSIEASRLHFTTWQDIRTWITSQTDADLSFVRSRLQEHPLL